MKGAYNAAEGTIKLVFKKGKADNPKINAIIIYGGSLEETEFAERKKRMDEMNKKRIQQLKMKNLLLKKHDVDEDFNEELELSTEEDIVTVKPDSTIMSTILSNSGAYIIFSLALFFILYSVIERATTTKARRTHKIK